MRRARSSVGTCALSKLLSRHKLLVSDQLLSSQNMLGHRIAFLPRFKLGWCASSLVVSGFGYFLCFKPLKWSFVFPHVSSVLQLCLFWVVCLQFLCYDLNLKQLRMVQKFSSVSLHTVGGKKQIWLDEQKWGLKLHFMLINNYNFAAQTFRVDSKSLQRGRQPYYVVSCWELHIFWPINSNNPGWRRIEVLWTLDSLPPDPRV